MTVQRFVSGTGPFVFETIYYNRIRDILERHREVQRRYVGYLAYTQQQVAKDLAHVITGRMRGAIAVVSPGEHIDVGRTDEPQEYGVSSPDEATEKVRVWGRRGYEIADVDVGAFAPYSAVEEYSRGHVFMAPAADVAQSESADALAYAEAFR